MPIPTSDSSPSTYFTIFIVLFILIVAFVVIRLIIRQMEISSLRQNGRKITATISKIERRRVAETQQQWDANGSTSHTTWRNVYYVVASWEDPETHIVRTFKSDRRSGYPRGYDEGSPVTVLINSDNPDKYYVDLT